ncbi:hypothetical protein EUX98_g3014 [Antrodiella citrinella]|uniref:AB hydrolase-1 domain-containing protein n=1 Tax=Antrodiella citrinella TaxID=2447956 RepID=A0A4S4MXL9_9APHY|nr:hypothetical protein EUX98_g3014 [Antrodiella citrinella]
MSPVTHNKNVTVDSGINIFYREAGSPTAPNVLLLHGFPASSFQFRHLIPRLAEKYHVVAPDLPGFGFTTVPEARAYKYTFANIAKTIGAFVDALELKKYAIYIFDYGAPTGLRLMLDRPGAVTAIITQNGNAYEEGLGAFWDPVKAYWANPEATRGQLKASFTSFDSTKWQYVDGVPNPDVVAPEPYHLDYYLMSRPGNADIQMDIIFDYQTNLKLYPEFHKYFKEHQPPTLAVWGKNDQIFIPPGAEAFKRDNKNVQVTLIDTGHFVLESNGDEVADLILAFFAKHNI